MLALAIIKRAPIETRKTGPVQGCTLNVIIRQWFHSRRRLLHLRLHRLPPLRRRLRLRLPPPQAQRNVENPMLRLV
jgi:hypothetical protein